MNKSEKQLINNYNALNTSERELLLEFSEFLAGRVKKILAIEEPDYIPRPDEETVVGAVKRMSATYAMLDKSKLLTDVSGFVTQNIVHGRDIGEVIDEIEKYFSDQYEEYVKEQKEAIRMLNDTVQNKPGDE